MINNGTDIATTNLFLLSDMKAISNGSKDEICAKNERLRKKLFEKTSNKKYPITMRIPFVRPSIKNNGPKVTAKALFDLIILLYSMQTKEA
tara:strand:- start:311 stop:583 length:273 start_codon:yes stop_codon:yes gene_type:complete